jgi:hypothetical protein
VRPSLHRLPPFVSLASWTSLTVALLVVSMAAADDTIRIWKIGSPHTGETPDATVPVALRRESTRRGLNISIEAFPAPARRRTRPNLKQRVRERRAIDEFASGN